MGIIWTIIIGFVAGVIAKFVMPGDNEPSGFILTTILGIVGAFVASYLGQSLGWYGPGEGAGLIGAVSVPSSSFWSGEWCVGAPDLCPCLLEKHHVQIYAILACPAWIGCRRRLPKPGPDQRNAV